MSASDRRSQLIEVALDVFSRQGFRGATTKEIAAQAGVAEGLIFRHFLSKEGLYTAVLDSRLNSPEQEKWVAEIKGHMDRDDDEGVFRSLIRRMIERYTRDPRFQRVVLFAALEGHELGLARLGEDDVPQVLSILKYIARRQKAAFFLQCEPSRVLLAVDGMAYLYGTVTQIFRFPIPQAPDDETAEAFTRIAMHGICRSKSTNPRKKAAK
jgi:TetR/AcrR family transcriptional regulator